MHLKPTLRILSLFIFSVFITADYEIIDLSDNKEKLSKEILLKFKKEHFIKNISKQTTNTDFIKGLINKLDESKSYFLEDEVNSFLSRSASDTNDYHINLAFEITNLYFERLVNFSEYQIELVTKNKFDMLIDEKIDIFEDDNIWLKSDKEQKSLIEERQKVKLKLNPHEIMEQIHYRLKERIIKYSISKQKERKVEKAAIEQEIMELKEELKVVTIGENERLEKSDRFAGKETSLEKIEEHQAKEPRLDQDKNGI